MLYLLHYLSGPDGWGPLRLFGYASVRTVAALATAFVLMLIVMPPLIRWLKRCKFGEAGAKNEGAAIVDAMREKKKGTPTMGGLGLVGCAALAAIMWCDPASLRTWPLIGGLLAFACVGFLDDRTKIFKNARGTPDGVKLGLQLLVALACGVALYAINEWIARGPDGLLLHSHPAGEGPESYRKALGEDSYIVRLAVHQMAFPFVPVSYALDLGLWMVLWCMFVTTACANGVNFTDGLDGLAGGTMFIAAIAFMVIAYVVGRVDAADYLRVLYVADGEEVAVFCAAIAGACLGFLWFNCSPAQVFMGDTGSQALGGVLGLVALTCKQEFLILLVGCIFVAEAASVAIQKGVFKATKHRPGGGVRVFRCAPLHHHFQHLGWSETTIVLRFWIIAAMGALLAIATLKVR
jgi:phospho-N-acetylmuramoyl-pentapeptide-transferase